MFNGHVGFVEKYDLNNPGNSMLFASNGRKVGDKGPSLGKFKYYGKPTKYLRPKPEFFLGVKQANPYIGLPYASPVVNMSNLALHIPKPRTNRKTIDSKTTNTQHPHAAEISAWHQQDYYNTKVWNIASRHYWRSRIDWDD